MTVESTVKRRTSSVLASAITALVAVRAGTPLTRRLICECARLVHGAVTLLIEEAADDEDIARTAVLSGRTDLVCAASPATTFIPYGAGEGVHGHADR